MRPFHNERELFCLMAFNMFRIRSVLKYPKYYIFFLLLFNFQFIEINELILMFVFDLKWLKFHTKAKL